MASPRRPRLEDVPEFWDQLWHDAKYGVLARGRDRFRALARLHASEARAAFAEGLADAFSAPLPNERDALQHAWGHLKRFVPHRDFEDAVVRGEARRWLFDHAATHDVRLANSRLLWDDPWPDRAWFGNPLRLGIVDGARVLVLPWEETRDAPDGATVLHRVRVAGRFHANPLLGTR